jgi:hypothetical protein
MSIEKEAAKLGIKGAKQGIKILWSWYRPWRTKLAYKREVEAEMKRKDQSTIIPMMFLAAFALSGCASLDKVYTGVDRTVHNGSLDPYQNQIPEGYEARPYVRDAAGNRVDITNWIVAWEIVPSAKYLPTLLPDAIAKPRSGAAFGPVLQTIAAATGQPTAVTPAASGADAAAALLQAEAVKDGAK